MANSSISVPFIDLCFEQLSPWLRLPMLLSSCNTIGSTIGAACPLNYLIRLHGPKVRRRLACRRQLFTAVAKQDLMSWPGLGQSQCDSDRGLFVCPHCSGRAPNWAARRLEDVTRARLDKRTQSRFFFFFLFIRHLIWSFRLSAGTSSSLSEPVSASFARAFHIHHSACV